MRAALHQALNDVRRELPFIAHAWVLLPEHLHCVWELPEDDAQLGLRWGLVKRQVTRACRSELAAELPSASASRIVRHEATFWQRRFWEHRIRDDRDFEKHVDYIHWNPVKHGHVKRVADRPFSTFHRFVRQGIYAEDWAGEAPKRWDGQEFGE